MCLAGEEQLGGSSSGAGAGGVGDGVPEILVTAPRLGLNMSMFESIDWAEVAKIAGFAAAGGALSGGGWQGAIGAGLAAGAGAIEAMEGVDVEDLFPIKYDMIVAPGFGPYFTLY